MCFKIILSSLFGFTYLWSSTSGVKLLKLGKWMASTFKSGISLPLTLDTEVIYLNLRLNYIFYAYYIKVVLSLAAGAPELSMGYFRQNFEGYIGCQGSRYRSLTHHCVWILTSIDFSINQSARLALYLWSKISFSSLIFMSFRWKTFFALITKQDLFFMHQSVLLASFCVQI